MTNVNSLNQRLNVDSEPRRLMSDRMSISLLSLLNQGGEGELRQEI